MKNLQFKSCLGIGDREIISIYGAGGKTSLLYLLAEELAAGGSKAATLVTTTTKIYQPPDRPLLLSRTLPEAREQLRLFPGPGPVLLAAGLLPGGKLAGVDSSWPGRLIEERPIGFILVEADGAAKKPLKGYAPYEPVLPPDSSIIIPVIGLSSLGSPLEPGRVHRPELFSAMAGMKMGEMIGVEHLVRAMKWMVDEGRRRAPRARVAPVFNQVDRVPDRKVIAAIAAAMAGEPALRHLFFTDARQPAPVKFIFDLSAGHAVPEVSCVVLAAGFSRRMGCNKLALALGDTTVLAQTLQNLAGTGFSEIIGVVNPETIDLGDRILNFGGRVVVNERSCRGIASSLQMGLSATSPTSQGVLFALGDQPLIPARVYRDLLDHYRLRLPLAAYPTYRGRRGNPVLFDRRTWSQLAKLEGDRGGSRLLGALPAGECCPVEMAVAEIALDLDTPADYEHILSRVKPGPTA